MNALSRIEPTPERMVYVPLVQRYLPGCSGQELGLRCSMLLMRDKATAVLRDCCPETAQILEAVERIATTHAFQPMSQERLERARYNLLRLVATASNFQGLSQGEIHADD